MSSEFRIEKKTFKIPKPGKHTVKEHNTIKKRAYELEIAKRQGQFSRIAQGPASVIPKEAYKVVADFIKEKKRKLYGGTAMNIHLPRRHKIYTQADYPDFDFFSPEPWKDAIKLANLLYDAGLKYTEAKAGIHKGTFKVFANFWPVADITHLPQDLYDQITTIKKNGYTIVSPAFLQMTLYNIISKPIEVPSRWPNVALRQKLLDSWSPAKYRKKQCGEDFIKADEFIEIDINLQKALDVVYREARKAKLIHYGALAYNKYIQLGDGKLRLPVYYYELLAQDAGKHAEAIVQELEKIIDNELITDVRYLPYKDMNNTSYVLYIKIESEEFPVFIITELTRCIPYKYFGGRYFCSIDYLKYELYTQMFYEDTDLHAYNVSCLIRYLDYIQNRYYKKKSVSETDHTPFERFVTKCRGPFVDAVREEFYSRWIKRAEEQKLITDLLPVGDSMTLTGIKGHKIRVYPKQYIEPPECQDLPEEDCSYPCAWIPEISKCGGIPFGGYQPKKAGPLKVSAKAIVNFKKK